VRAARALGRYPTPTLGILMNAFATRNGFDSALQTRTPLPAAPTAEPKPPRGPRLRGWLHRRDPRATPK
jgi:hypothetical protein